MKTVQRLTRVQRLFGGALAVPAILAAVACGTGSELETRTFDLQHLSPGVAQDIVGPYVFAERERDPGSLSVSGAGGVITVRERPENLDAIARVLEERDRARPGVVLRFRVIEAGPDGPDGSAGPAAAGDGGADPALAEVEAALRDVLRFERYRLLGEGMVRASEMGDFSQELAGGAGFLNGRLWSVRSSGDGAASGRLQITYQPPSGAGPLETTLNIVDGRTTVIGTAAVRESGGALILTVHPEFES